MIYSFDEFELDAERAELRHAGKLVHAEAMAIRLLTRLVDSPGQLVTKEELIESVWEGRVLADNAITVCAARLRKVLRQHGGPRQYVATVYGRGYRFVRPVTRCASASRHSGPPASTREQENAFCVGRERIIARLLRRHALAVERQGSLCAVMGTAGVGKTRVVEAFEGRMGPHPRVVWAYCRDSGTAPPLSPWLRLLRPVAMAAWTPAFEQTLGPHANEVRAWLGIADPRAAAERARGRAFDEPRTGPDTIEPPRRSSLEAILRTLTLVSETTPLCLVLDDLHRADAASLELLHMLLDEIAHTRILLVCTVRQTEAGAARRPDTHLPAILGHRNCERLPLDRLERADVETYLQARLGRSDRASVDAVLAGSEGIPFFMVELARQIEAHGLPDASALKVPAPALELFRARVASLTETTRHVLRVAAVIGLAFELPLLQKVCNLSPPDTLAAIDEAIAFDVLVAAPGTASAFAFEHELMRRAVYEGISQAERRRLHFEVANAIEQRGNEGEEATHALAHHLHAALPNGEPDKVVQYCERAARAAGAVFANPDVVAHLRRALDALELQPDSDPRHRARLHLLKAMYSRGQPGSSESLEVVRRLAEKLGDAALLARVAFMYNPHPLLAPVASARALLEQVLALASPRDDSVRASALACLACTAPDCFDRTHCEALLAEASRLAHRPGNESARYPALLAELHLLGGPPYGARRARLRDELAVLARAHRETMPVLPIDVALDHALDAMQRGRLDEVRAALERAARRARAINHRELQWHVQRLQAWAELEQHPSAGAVVELTELHRRAERDEVLGLALFCAFDRCLLAFDQYATARPASSDLLALAYTPIDPVHVWAMKLRALTAAARTTEARETLRAVSVEGVAHLPWDGQALGSLAQLGRAAIALDEPEYARAVLQALSPHADWFAVNIGFRCEGAVAHVLGELAGFLGDRERARKLVEQGLAMSERAGLVRCAADARRALAEYGA